MKNETKLNWAFWLSIVAILVSTAVVILWACDALHYSVVTLDTFIGVVVALLAIIVTIILGWQIYNAIDIRQRMKKIDELEKNLQDQQKQLVDASYSMHHLIGVTWGNEAYLRGDYILSFRRLIDALNNTMHTIKCQNANTIIDYMKECCGKMQDHSNIQKKWFEEIKEDNEDIRESANYHFIQERYEAIYGDFIRKVSVEE